VQAQAMPQGEACCPVLALGVAVEVVVADHWRVRTQ
jgi:hypothetical protein